MRFPYDSTGENPFYDGRYHSVIPEKIYPINLANREFYILDYFDSSRDSHGITLLARVSDSLVKVPLDDYSYLVDFMHQCPDLEAQEVELPDSISVAPSFLPARDLFDFNRNQTLDIDSLLNPERAVDTGGTPPSAPVAVAVAPPPVPPVPPGLYLNFPFKPHYDAPTAMNLNVPPPNENEKETISYGTLPEEKGREHYQLDLFVALDKDSLPDIKYAVFQLASDDSMTFINGRECELVVPFDSRKRTADEKYGLNLSSFPVIPDLNLREKLNPYDENGEFCSSKSVQFEAIGSHVDCPIYAFCGTEPFKFEFFTGIYDCNVSFAEFEHDDFICASNARYLNIRDSEEWKDVTDKYLSSKNGYEVHLISRDDYRTALFTKGANKEASMEFFDSALYPVSVEDFESYEDTSAKSK